MHVYIVLMGLKMTITTTPFKYVVDLAVIPLIMSM